LITCNFCNGEEEAGLTAAKALDRAIAGLEVPSPLKAGYSGCALATGEPLLKDIGVVKMRDHFDVYVGGDAKSLCIDKKHEYAIQNNTIENIES
jgi:precorrin-3B C17-methyltransferase